MKCLVVNSVASNHVQHVSTNTFHLDANSGNSSQHDPLIELEMPAYSGSSREITGHFLMELTLSSHLCLDHSRGRTQTSAWVPFVGCKKSERGSNLEL